MTTETNEDLDFPEMEYFLNESLSDIVFVVDGHRLPAIKAILILKSRVFRTMFSGKFIESKESEESKLPVIEIKETTVEAFKALLQFVYTEHLVFEDDNDFEHIWDIFQLADRYEVLRLRGQVRQHLFSKINFKGLNPISRFAFNHNIEELKSKVMTFIESNINQLIRKDNESLKQLNESTHNKLLDVLTGDGLEFKGRLKCFVVKEKSFYITEEVLFKNHIFEGTYRQQIENTSIEAFKVFVGYLYFDKLILKDEEDLQLIREVCKLSKRFEQNLLFKEIGSYLKNRITVENLDQISGIAYLFDIEELQERVEYFTKRNANEIKAKNVNYFESY